MIEFMVLGAPRSGTAWAANWLTTERTLCLHDIMFDHTLDQVDSLPCDRVLGLADTGLGLFPDFLLRHPARKVVLHRNPAEINASLRNAGLPKVNIDWYAGLRNLTGDNVMHVEWDVLFKGPQIIHHFLFGSRFPFDQVRHALLAKMNVQMDFEKIDPDPKATREMIKRIREAAAA